MMTEMLSSPRRALRTKSNRRLNCRAPPRNALCVSKLLKVQTSLELC